MRSVNASAKTREEAIKKALGELGVEMYEVDKIEIVDEGSKGLFGFGARPVQVKVIVENLPAEPRRRVGEGERRERSSGDRGRRPENRRQERKSRGGRPGQSPRTDKDGERPARAEQKSRPGKGRGRGQRGERQGADKGDARRGDQNRSKPARTEQRPVNTPPKARRERPEEDLDLQITDEQGLEAAILLQEIIAKMGLAGTVEFARMEDGSSRLNVASEDSAILIGRKGRNLSAMQYLINRIISRNDTAENTERLVVDVEGYVDRRRASLEDMAKTFAEKAKSTGRNMRLKPLSPQERRIIHVTLENDPDLRTYSLGESLYRSVIISPKDAKNDRPPQERGGRGGRGRRGRGGRGRNGGGNARQQDSDPDAGTFGD